MSAAGQPHDLDRQAQVQQLQDKDTAQAQQASNRKDSPGPTGVAGSTGAGGIVGSGKKDTSAVGGGGGGGSTAAAVAASSGQTNAGHNKTAQPGLQRTGSGSVSAEVKQKLAEFVLAKKQREAAQNGVPLRHPWTQRQQMSLDQSSPPPANGRPGASAVPGKSDFPLRKTASEPNLKVRSVLKQKVMNRSSPLLLRRRGEKLIRRRIPLSLDSQNYVSSEGSPPSAASAHSSLHSSLGSSNGTPISEELAPPGGALGMATLVPTASGNVSGAVLYQTPNQSACSVLPPAGQILEQSMLYSSPSMPNISLGRPSATQASPIIDGKMLMSEAQMRAMAAARLGLPLASHHVLQPTLAFCSQLPENTMMNDKLANIRPISGQHQANIRPTSGQSHGLTALCLIDGDVTPPTSPVFLHSGHLRSLEQQSGVGALLGTGLASSSGRPLSRPLARPDFNGRFCAPSAELNPPLFL
ncbi:histone deacetylase 4-like [Tropilaelaps mercedesae]|uniref:histone deacetylase n=1 Tax=Tropilaelaps mercedesae TaxID=418985 RepID=A0A1V9XJE2_9ACAR|nr:histone deacetylase 4-like [Tropilaelaps mercedesae]